MSTEGVYSRDMGRGNSREGWGVGRGRACRDDERDGRTAVFGRSFEHRAGLDPRGALLPPAVDQPHGHPHLPTLLSDRGREKKKKEEEKA